MKSQEKAELKFKNACNTSTAKFQYSFGKSLRFNQRADLKKAVLDKFYDLPSQLSKHSNTFAQSKRDLQKPQGKEGPSPCQYTLKTESSARQIFFRPGREQCKSASAFYNSNINFPGPDKYSPQKPKTTTFIHMGSRFARSYSTISPGPKYSFETTLNDRNKILSSLTKKGSVRFVLPSSKRRVLTQSQELPSPPKESADGYVGRVGQRKLGQSGCSTVIGKQKRFNTKQQMKDVPGPGSYSSFSDFVETSN